MTRACKVSAQFLGHWWANVSQSVLNSLDQNKYQNMDSSVLFSCYLSMTSDLSFFIFNSEQCSSFFFFFFICSAPLPHAHLCLPGFTVMGKITKIFREVNRKSF